MPRLPNTADIAFVVVAHYNPLVSALLSMVGLALAVPFMFLGIVLLLETLWGLWLLIPGAIASALILPSLLRRPGEWFPIKFVFDRVAGRMTIEEKRWFGLSGARCSTVPLMNVEIVIDRYDLPEGERFANVSLVLSDGRRLNPWKSFDLEGGDEEAQLLALAMRAFISSAKPGALAAR